jgi:hypothetical protein
MVASERINAYTENPCLYRPVILDYLYSGFLEVKRDEVKKGMLVSIRRYPGEDEIGVIVYSSVVSLYDASGPGSSCEACSVLVDGKIGYEDIRSIREISDKDQV